MDLLKVMERFPDQESCIEHLEKIRWKGNPKCPHCDSQVVRKRTETELGCIGRWQCHDCTATFKVTHGTIDITDLKDSDLYDYDIKGDPKVTKAQNKRIRKRQTRWQNGEITDLEYRRSWAEILSETNDSLAIAKVLRNYGGVGSVASQVALEYAELATAESPDSFEAHHVWALSNYSYYYETDFEKVISGFRQLVERFPNSSIANFEMAWILAPVVPVLSASLLQKMEAETALVYLKRAIQLDDRIASNNSLLAKCYFFLGEYEKTLAVYQGMSELYFGQMGGLVTFIYHAQEEVFKLRQQVGE